MKRNIEILGILMLLMIFSINGVLGQVGVNLPSECEEGFRICGEDSNGYGVIRVCEGGEYRIEEICESNERCGVDYNGPICEVIREEVIYGETENNSFIGSLSTNHLLIGVIILLIVLIVLIVRLKSKKLR